MVKKAEKFKSEDKKKKELVDLKNEADGVLFNVEKSFSEHRSKLPESDQQLIQEEIDKLKSFIAKDITVEEIGKLKNQIQDLKNASMKIGQAMYSKGN